MDIFVNNTVISVSEKASLSDALSAAGLAGRQGIAIAINNQVIPRTVWDTHLLYPADKVTIIKATQGG